MTREEAIEVIKLAMAQVEWDYPMDYAAAFDMAIKALEQEPTTKNDLGVDCISRKQAIDAFPDLLPNMGYNKKAIMEILQELPSVTPQEPILDNIRAEIETKYRHCKLTEHIVQYDGICTSVNDIGDIADILQIIDKYKAETEEI